MSDSAERAEAILTVYVSGHCAGSSTTRDVLDAPRTRSERIQIEVVDVDEAGLGSVPTSVFSVPTYMLNGRVISLGNSPLDVLAQLAGGGAAADAEGMLRASNRPTRSDVGCMSQSIADEGE